MGIEGRMGSFEVFANLGEPQGKIAIVHLFSKRMSGMWPHFSAVGNRATGAITEAADNGDLKELAEKYTTRGMVPRNEAADSPRRTSRFRATS